MNPSYEGPYKVRFGSSALTILKLARVGRLSEAVEITASDLEQIKTLYDCELLRTDKAVGNMVDTLEAWGCLDRTMIIVSADHGEEFLERGSLDHGQTVYEESIRVPLIVYCPALVSGPKKVAQQVGLIDLGPTILDALGIEIPEAYEGTSLMPLMSSDFKASGAKARPCGLPTTCLVASSVAHRPEKKALRCPPWKLIFDPFFGASELYNLTDDPGETANLIEIDPETASALTDMLLSTFGAYYPGGWCVAWRGGNRAGRVQGKVHVAAGLVEVLSHGLHPDIDTDTDSLATSEDDREVRFATLLDDAWEGIQVVLPSRSKAALELGVAGSRSMPVLVGNDLREATFPMELVPDQALVDRSDLHRLFRQTGADVVIFWLDPGSDPSTALQTRKDLKRKLKTLGYID